VLDADAQRGGKPQARNLCEMLACLQKLEGTVLDVRAAAAA